MGHYVGSVLTFRIVPNGREFWLEAIGGDGSHRFLQRFDTEDAAVHALAVLQGRAAAIERRIKLTSHGSPGPISNRTNDAG